MNLLSDFRIGFDARLSMGRYRGMGRFTRALVARREDSFVAFCAKGEEDRSLPTVAYGPRFYPVWEQYAIPKLARKFNLEFFLAPYNTGPLNLPSRTKLLLVIYDLIYLEPRTSLPLSKSVYQNVGRYYRRYVVPRAAQKAYRIVTTSEYSRQEITSRLGIEPARISVIPVALKADWFEDRSLECHGERFILAVGGEAPSKNIGRGIQAFAKYTQLSSDRSMMLKIAGVKGKYHAEFYNIASACGIRDRVQLLAYLEEEELRALYKRASLFFMPSLFEGFGIPVLEALASGTPVISSNRTSLPEVGGSAARYFDPESIDEMASAMVEVLSNPDLSSVMRAKGCTQALKFHPSVVGKKIDAFWESLG